MINYYGLITTNLLTIYLFSKLFTLLPKKTTLTITTVILVIANNVNIYQNINLIELIFGFINYISISTTLFITIIILSKLSNSYRYYFVNTSCAFIPIFIVFYSSLFLFTQNLFDYGFTPSTVLAPIFIYAVLLIFISKKFILFNVILIISTISTFSEIIGVNVWNYIIDPSLLIICIFEIIGYLIYLAVSKYKKTKLNNAIFF